MNIPIDKPFEGSTHIWKYRVCDLKRLAVQGVNNGFFDMKYEFTEKRILEHTNK